MLGVEVLAQAIDSIITRVQVAFIDTTFRLEYVPTIAPRGLALEIKVKIKVLPVSLKMRCCVVTVVEFHVEAGKIP